MEKYGADVAALQRAELAEVKKQISAYEADEDGLSKTAAAELSDLRQRAADLEDALAGV